MKERPILFNGAMVRAILSGDKTQTRRQVKGRALEWLAPGMFSPGYVAHPDNGMCLYGLPGDRLWVRESFWGCDLPGYGDQPCVVYEDEWVGKDYAPAEARPWSRKFGHIPAIHMPREASRILLEVVSVRIERLCEISEADAVAEGCETICMTPTGEDTGSAIYGPDGYAALWESINGPDSWAANPWVWVIEFKRVDQ